MTSLRWHPLVFCWRTASSPLFYAKHFKMPVLVEFCYLNIKFLAIRLAYYNKSGIFAPTKILTLKQKIDTMYWTLELASKLEDAPWPASKDELIDYAMRSGAPMEVVENLQELEDEGEVY